MRHTIIGGTMVALVMAIGAVACTKNTSAPSNSTTTTTAATTTSTSTSVVTSSVPVIFNVRGTVTSEKTGELLKFADIEIIQGANLGKRFQGDGNGAYIMSNLGAGTFVARFWAAGYLIKDVTITLSTSDQTVNVQLTPAPPSTTTTPNNPLKADFTFSPNPCTIDVSSTNCTVTSQSTGNIIQTHWAYANKDVFDQTQITLQFGCGDLRGTGVFVTLNVRLTVVDDTGAADSVDIGIPVQKLNGVCP